MFLVLALLLLIFLPSPWNLAAALASALLGAVEVLYWERRIRTHRVRTGVIGVEDLRLEVRPAGSASGGARAAGSAALLAVLVLGLAGCGGDDGGSASEDYADGVCSSLNTWADSVQTTVQEVADEGLSITGDDVRTAVDDVKDANQTLREDIGGLGPPESEDGNKAKSDLDNLMTVLSQQIENVDEAVASGGGSAAIAGAVTSAVATAANAVNATYQELRELDPAGELSDAFENSDECKSLEDQLEDRGSDGS